MRRRRGFTLAELLVVLAVVALLVGLLLPALQRARDVAEGVACLSNTRQLGIALNGYLVNSDGLLPTLFNRGATTQPGPAIDTLFDEAPALHACPADEEEIWAATGTSYFWNFTLNGQRVESAFSLIGGADAGRIPVLSDKEGFHPHAPDRVNVLYADGHSASELRFVLPPDAPTPP
ncbi:prepilin-type N-terminal cleavage/methylation domain-containing protein [Phycisphaera mikurensis]|uniref:Prepilin-type N-terminal cleavage/methylation domain-containing protein n=1 Tax=Phycisphaera mikurensis (strain NBRC 102666 / KCTC 22515 / FYK2301M01) TaxID=1142394 RepID=I0IES3_PHYMF|nr:prepilin-type N-terminal cleavage/methylation domain-containing protein [Phycisphaera mikurensis]MBB6441556.1 prepilin-type N-terminal cleavage/methylation domain-containing protein/prepilin-type processing-associated H-X9-DG protein [Phycisphaera mikurensis]BAM03761.1 hypothetical protein PSMK_16020 [Phycisphaera mikurensis NBRC 102666]